MPSTKLNNHGTQQNATQTLQQQQPQLPVVPSKPNRRGWLFHRGGGGGGKASATAATATPGNSSSVEYVNKTNNSRSSVTTSSNDTTTTTSAAAMGHMTNNYNNNGSVEVPGILKKETKDYDAIIASKRYQEQIKNTSWFCRTKYFQTMCHMAFDAMDSDASGQMDEKELYAGLLLIHLQLGMYAGPAACRPLSREQVHTVFVK